MGKENSSGNVETQRQVVDHDDYHAKPVFFGVLSSDTIYKADDDKPFSANSPQKIGLGDHPSNASLNGDPKGHLMNSLKVNAKNAHDQYLNEVSLDGKINATKAKIDGLTLKKVVLTAAEGPEAKRYLS